MSDSDLVDWLRGVLDRLERAANEQNAGGSSEVWRVQGDFEDYDEPATIRSTSDDVEATLTDPGIGEHIALNDPRSVLARVEAERAILRQHETTHALLDRSALTPLGEQQYGWMADALDDAVAWLAYGHRYDTDGWDPAWAPEGVETT